MSKEKESFSSDEEIDGQLKSNFVVKTQIARLDNGKTRRTGKPKRHTVRTMTNAINKYFDWCMAKDRVPSIKGMMIHMKMLRDQFYQYIEYPEFKSVMEQSRMIISEWVENDIYRTPGQCAGKIAYAKNIMGWADKIDTTSVNETTVRTVLSVEDARARIASLAHLIDPGLLESLDNKYILDQMTPKAGPAPKQLQETIIDVDSL